MVALLAAAATLAQHDGAPPVGFGERVEVIARSVYVDVLDESKRAVGAIPAGTLSLTEDGVARPVLEVRLRPAAGTGAAAPAGVVATAASGVHATPAPRFVLVALDPVTLGRQAWKTAIAHLDAAAEALVGIGPVDVVALTTPPLRAATGTTDAAAVRGALARVATSVTPLDRFYLGRFRVVRELEQVALQRSPLIEAQRVLQELTNEEEPLLRDALGRSWQLATIQLDFQMPERFELEYIDENNDRKRPVMIHRAIMGSMERFIGVLIEHFAGAFPTWLSPVQAAVLPISDQFMDYGREVETALRDAGVRAELDDRNEKIGYKIRDWEMHKVPYMLIVGEKEREARTVSVRRHKEGDLGARSIDEFVFMIGKEIEEKLL